MKTLSESQRVFNFSAGPATLPVEVLEQIQQELFNYQGLGVSILELGHRTGVVDALMNEIKQDLADLLHLPDYMKVLFLPGGATMQFAALPMNLLRQGFAQYAITGFWSGRAAMHAEPCNRIQRIEAIQSKDPYIILPSDEWPIDKNAAYLHYCANDTIEGVKVAMPSQCPVPLVADMSSCLLSEPIDASAHKLIYACAQKNCGPAGITMVMVDDRDLSQAHDYTPAIVNYQRQMEANSMCNTPPVFPIYVTGLVLKWLKRQGGVEAIAKINQAKAKTLYDYIDQSDLYINSVDPSCRSIMNVTFHFADKDLVPLFVEEAEKAGCHNLKGHRSYGGIRASIYNATPQEGVDRLIECMQTFANKQKR